MGEILSSTIVGLDIGTSFIKIVIGEVNPETQKLEIIGFAKCPSQGLRVGGAITNIEACVKAIKSAIEEAEQAAGVEVLSFYTAIGGSQVQSLNTKGQIGVDATGKKNRPIEIDRNAKDRAIEAAKAVLISIDKRLLHILPQEYIIDGIGGYENPIGQMGVRLEVAAHLVTVSVTPYESLRQCVIRSGYNLNGVMLKTLAETFSSLSKEDMKLGSILIDLGGGTTDFIVLSNGAPIYSSSIPYGGKQVTDDIAVVKGITFDIAEKLKIEYGTCWLFGGEEKEEVIIPGIGGKAPEQTNKLDLYEIIESRVEEILTMVRQDVGKKAQIKKLDGCIVLTGGGALMPGVVELTQSVFRSSSVRVACGPDLGGADDSYRNPEYSTAVGLVIANKDVEFVTNKKRKKNTDCQDKNKSSWFKNLIRRLS